MEKKEKPEITLHPPSSTPHPLPKYTHRHKQQLHMYIVCCNNCTHVIWHHIHIQSVHSHVTSHVCGCFLYTTTEPSHVTCHTSALSTQEHILLRPYTHFDSEIGGAYSVRLTTFFSSIPHLRAPFFLLSCYLTAFSPSKPLMHSFV